MGLEERQAPERKALFKPSEVADLLNKALIKVEEEDTYGDLHTASVFAEEYLRHLNTGTWDDDSCMGILDTSPPCLVSYTKLNDLPVGTYVLDREGDIWQRVSEEFWAIYESGAPNHQPNVVNWGPYRVLSVPEFADEGLSEEWGER